ncbi:hypothetical protein LTR92_002627, partial [Exophiala xenobiotica]
VHPCQLLKWLLPQYLQPGGLRLKKKLGPTSYLDALRGWAAWIVLNHHLNENPQIWILRQPIFEVVHKGIAMVDIFFIISGFVLSQKILKLIREKDDQNVLHCIASSTFRRYARLYFSSAAGAAISMIMIHLNWMVGPPTPRLDSWLDQIWDWIRDMVSFSNPFAHVTGWWYTGVFTSRYCQVLWTIPVEFKASMVVFLFCAASCKFKSPTYRLVGCWLLILLCYCWQTVYVALFMFGVFLAELSLSRSSVSEINLPVADTDLPRLENEKPGREKAGAMGTCVVSTIMLATGMYLLNEPEHGQLPYFGYLIPSWWEGGDEGRQHFRMSISAALIVYALETCPTLQVPFNTGFSQYLGHISFGLYVMHISICRSFYAGLLTPFRQAYLGESLWWYFAMYVLYILAAMWAADWFTRLDRQVVSFGRWLEKQTFA